MDGDPLKEAIKYFLSNTPQHTADDKEQIKRVIRFSYGQGQNPQLALRIFVEYFVLDKINSKRLDGDELR